MIKIARLINGLGRKYGGRRLHYTFSGVRANSGGETTRSAVLTGGRASAVHLKLGASRTGPSGAVRSRDL